MTYGKHSEVAGTSNDTMHELSMLRQIQNHEIENEKEKTANCGGVDTQSIKSPQVGRSSGSKLSSDRTCLAYYNPFSEPFSTQRTPCGEYGNIGSPVKKGTGSSSPVIQTTSPENYSYGESGNVVSSAHRNERCLQTPPQSLKKVSPPIVPGAAPWNDSVWDNYWLHKPEMMYRREADRNSVITMSPKANSEEDRSHEEYNRPHTARALSDQLRKTSEDEIRSHGLNADDLTVQTSREQAMKEGFTGMTDLITKSALDRRARQNWVERSGGLTQYARLMGDDQ